MRGAQQETRLEAIAGTPGAYFVGEGNGAVSPAPAVYGFKTLFTVVYRTPPTDWTWASAYGWQQPGMMLWQDSPNGLRFSVEISGPEVPSIAPAGSDGTGLLVACGEWDGTDSQNGYAYAEIFRNARSTQVVTIHSPLEDAWVESYPSGGGTQVLATLFYAKSLTTFQKQRVMAWLDHRFSMA